MGSAPITTEAIAATNSANRCQAVGPPGPRAPGRTSRPSDEGERCAPQVTMLASGRRPPAVIVGALRSAHPPRETDCAALDAVSPASSAANDVLPGEGILRPRARRSGPVPPVIGAGDLLPGLRAAPRSAG